MGHGRTNTEKAVPNNPENKAKIRYSVPLEMGPRSPEMPPQRTVRASHPAHGSTVDQLSKLFPKYTSYSLSS